MALDHPARSKVSVTWNYKRSLRDFGPFSPRRAIKILMEVYLPLSCFLPYNFKFLISVHCPSENLTGHSTKTTDSHFIYSFSLWIQMKCYKRPEVEQELFPFPNWKSEAQKELRDFVKDTELMNGRAWTKPLAFESKCQHGSHHSKVMENFAKPSQSQTSSFYDTSLKVFSFFLKQGN